MFVGQYAHSVDAKGRLAVPAKFRNELKKAVVTKGLENCLVLYPKKQWDVLAGKLAALPISKANSRAFARMMLAGAMDVSVDSQGRIILPEYLRTFAGLDKKVVITGLYDRLEIWDEAQWHKYQSETEKNSGEIAEALNDLGV
jgi:MraZ protein